MGRRVVVVVAVVVVVVAVLFRLKPISTGIFVSRD